MTNEEFGVFEKSALAFLKSLGLTPVGYYPYSHCSDVVGYWDPPPPFRVRTKMMAEIVRELPTRSSIEGFHKLAQDSLVERIVLICRTPLAHLSSDLQSLVEGLRIEFFDQATISTELERRKVGESEILAFSKLYEIVAPPAIAGALPEIAQRKTPPNMKGYVEKLGLKPWQVFEQGVYSVFNFCLGLTVRKLGEECLFEHEPEGVVIASGTQPFAMIYECKTAQDSYVMTSDHELRYEDYIKKKKGFIQIMEKVPLSYFVLVAPGFSGDVAERREKIYRETQVLTVLMPASVLASVAKWAWALPSDAKALIDLRRIFRLEEVIVSESTFTDYAKEFEGLRQRW
jgi:hypothetical protein